MQQIAAWLEKLGMPEYGECFAENKIDLSVLPHLTDQDLKDIGIPLGHRRKMLAAIAQLDDMSSASAPAPASTPPTVISTAPPTSEAVGERRHVTVMFCDLVDSTGITSRLDAEEWRDLVGAYLNAASAAVTEMGGKVAKKLGDGLMALFGYPLAQENDAERAVRAALAIQRSLAELNRKNASFGKPALAARIAIDLGPVVVDATGEIFGDVPNVAARAQALAEPGSVVVTARVQRQIAGLFVAEERGSHELKGVPEPVTLFRLVRASGGGRRAGQRHLTPLVGREEEIAMLMRRWERARQGDGQLVLIVGEPGLGKSRLIEEFHSRLRETPHTWVEWSCSQLLQNTPLHPIVEWGRQRFGGADVPAEQRLADLESTLTQVKLGSAESASLLAPLLDIPLSSERSVELVPEELRRRQMAALTNWVMAGARAQPIVLAIEDAHWADPTTLELLRGIAERGALAPLLVVITARQEFRPAWGVRSHHATISLVPLDREQVRDMVSGLAARHALSKEVIEGMTERTGGVPLFVEEVTRLLLERGEQGGVQAIPPTLQQSLTARLDRLGSAREVAQIGAVIGRDFSYGLLRDVAGIADAALEAALERLADADILLVLGLPPDSDYRFKHALIQDAAYENLLKSRRQALHRRVAETLRDRFADSATAEPEALAHHFTQAGMTDAAIEWWGKAGDQALRRSAFQEAISHLGKAIEMADKAEEDAPRAAPTPAAAEQRLKLQTVYANALIHARGHGAPETSAAFAKAQTLAAGLGEAADRFSAYYGRWVGSLNRCEPAIVQEAAAAFLRETELRPDSPEAGVAYRISGLTRLYFGDYAEARANIEKALAILKSERDRELAFRFGQDQVAAAMIYMALVLWPLGDVELARQFADQAASQAAKSGNLQTLAYVNYHLCLFEALRGDRERAVPVAKAVLDLAHERAMPIWESAGRLLHGWANWLVGDQRMELAEMRRGIERWRELGQAFHRPYLGALLAEAEASAGNLDIAIGELDRFLAEAQSTGERWSNAELHRVRGELLIKRDPANTAAAEEAFLTAIGIAQRQKTRSFELRAAMSTARLWRDQGKRDDARELLAPVYGWFTEGFDTRDLKEAKALLDELAA